MLIDISPRMAGKTTRAVEWLKVDPKKRAIVVHNSIEQDRLMRRYKLSRQQVLIFSQLLNRTGVLGHRREFFIDNAEYLLEILCDNRLAGFSATGIKEKQ